MTPWSVYNSRSRVVSSIFVLAAEPRLLLWSCIDCVMGLLMSFLCCCTLHTLQCSQGTCIADAFVDFETELKISFLYSCFYLSAGHDDSCSRLVKADNILLKLNRPGTPQNIAVNTCFQIL